MSCDSGLSLSFDLPLDYSLHSSYDNDVLAMGHEAGTSNVSPDDSGDNCGSPQSDKKPRIPQCARCQNHGIYVAVKGHKRKCPFKDCVCELCLLTVQRRELMAKTIAVKRSIEEDLHTNQIVSSNIVDLSRFPLKPMLKNEAVKQPLKKRCQNDMEANETARILSPPPTPTSSTGFPALNSAAEKKREPKCARCQNHEIFVAVKRHKRKCQFKDCECELCLLTVQRQKLMAKTIAVKRRLQEDSNADEAIEVDFSKLSVKPKFNTNSNSIGNLSHQCNEAFKKPFKKRPQYFDS